MKFIRGLKEDTLDIENEKNFACDMTLWPPLEYGHIFCHFIERPGVYTKRQLLQWKSLDSYNYFQSGHVREVKIMILNRGNCLLKALVNPGQKSPSHPYQAWVAVKEDGSIITAHCTCMAGYV